MLKLFQFGPSKSLENVNRIGFMLSRFRSNKQCSKSEKGSAKKEKVERAEKSEKIEKYEKPKKNEVPKLAINGFGRIGRTVMRVAVEHSCPLEMVAINDPMMSPEYMAYLLKHDSTHGRFIGDVEVDGTELIIDGKRVCTYKEADPKTIPWKELGVDYVVEATGKFTSTKKAQAHLTNGAKKVVITASCDAPTYVVGGNLEAYDPSHKVVSTGSCITNALSPLVKVIHENFEVIEGLSTTVHSITLSQKTIDSSTTRNWRRGRGALQNIIPTSTGAATGLSKVLPELEGKLTAMSIRVPVANVSMLDFTCRLKKETSLDEIKCVLRDAMEGPMMGIIDVTDDEVVSSDFNGSHYSCIYDAKASLALNKNNVKLIAWYDNEYGYSCRVIDLIKFMHAEEE